MAKNKNRKVWFISDTHFGHDKIREYCRPQFTTLDQMEDAIITHCREAVHPNDLVYHLGDFAWKTEDAVRVRPLLTGTIRLIVGNHDEIPSLAKAGLFQRMSLWRSFPEYGFHATHVPSRREDLRHANLNVHGHVHGDTEGLEDFHLDVSVEATDYRPVPSHELQEWACATIPGTGRHVSLREYRELRDQLISAGDND